MRNLRNLLARITQRWHCELGYSDAAVSGPPISTHRTVGEQMTQQLAEPASVGAPRAAPVGKKSVRGAMPRYIAKRLAQSLLTLFLTLSTVFVLIRMAPGDPAYAMAGPLATSEDLAL